MIIKIFEYLLILLLNVMLYVYRYFLGNSKDFFGHEFNDGARYMNRYQIIIDFRSFYITFVAL